MAERRCELKFKLLHILLGCLLWSSTLPYIPILYKFPLLLKSVSLFSRIPYLWSVLPFEICCHDIICYVSHMHHDMNLDSVTPSKWIYILYTFGVESKSSLFKGHPVSLSGKEFFQGKGQQSHLSHLISNLVSSTSAYVESSHWCHCLGCLCLDKGEASPEGRWEKMTFKVLSIPEIQ